MRLVTWLVAASSIAAAAGAATVTVAAFDALDEAEALIMDLAGDVDLARAGPLVDVESGDFCRVAQRAPESVPPVIRVAFVDHETDQRVDGSGAIEALRDAFPALRFREATEGHVEVRVTDAALTFEGDPVAGLACRASILIREGYEDTSTMVHEMGHVLGLVHEDDSWMEEGRDRGDVDAWDQWTREQTLHLAEVVPGAPWPGSILSGT